MIGAGRFYEIREEVGHRLSGIGQIGGLQVLKLSVGYEDTSIFGNQRRHPLLKKG
jgi:hypothetical protein